MKVKSCPFCGGRPTLFEDNYDKYAIMCENCNMYFGIELEDGVELENGWKSIINSLEEAVEMWNRRAEND
jgi:Lar family restriction alleviation protein